MKITRCSCTSNVLYAPGVLWSLPRPWGRFCLLTRAALTAHTMKWSSQLYVNRIPADHLPLAAAVPKILLYGNVEVHEGLQSISHTTYHKHQRRSLPPTISWQWTKQQSKPIQTTN